MIEIPMHKMETKIQVWDYMYNTITFNQMQQTVIWGIPSSNEQVNQKKKTKQTECIQYLHEDWGK